MSSRDSEMYSTSTVVSEYLDLSVVGPKNMKKQNVVGWAKVVSAITRLDKVRLTWKFACGKIPVWLKCSHVLGLIGLMFDYSMKDLLFNQNFEQNFWPLSFRSFLRANYHTRFTLGLHRGYTRVTQGFSEFILELYTAYTSDIEGSCKGEWRSS